MTALLIALAAAGGAAARFLVDSLVSGRLGRWPWGTLCVNLSGSLALGLLVGLTLEGVVSPTDRLVVGTGFLGAYTTFSTWMYDCVRLTEQGAWGRAWFNALGSLMLGVLAAALGLWTAGQW
ncbi:fluoride efflux transporter CrcB [Deinococcus peraridilitoris]|uniref:Fluoride-specific ion channel FluC n=1 Tax=Deinococcus peraridilitoris (strain DSM 19664 / LMG 22246 / CIP 109416 / KR-200) TaxID=937777 RepID=K9ZZV0_DEIPD|nr:fluoride efflux transporter CrcB [Deinococcus peraridilitoris]AFZ67148.1 crcB protein [Deinococcus peraridilitoris DSM 19664]